MSAARQIVYCHGMPGGPDELALFPESVPLLDFFAPDRARVDPALSHEELIEQMVRRIAQRYPQGEVIIIGFSLGAFHALQLAVRLRERVSQLHLIAAAAPPDREGLLDQMAGGPIFRLARSRPRTFAAVVRTQAVLARFIPALLVRMLLVSAQGADKPLSATDAFRHAMCPNVQSGYRNGGAAFIREVSAYMQPWRALLGCVHCPVTLWHGSADNWSPEVMADDLESALPGPVTRHRLPGASHYSTLRIALRALADEAGR